MKTLQTKEPTPQEILEACERVAVSKGFQNSDRMVRFLRFVVERALEGRAGELKEYLLGVEVFDRPESFDPKADTIVRVEARRLRRKLSEYYEGEGAGDLVRIEMPQPGYVPAFRFSGAAGEAPTRRRWMGLAGAGLAGATGLGYLGWGRWRTTELAGVDSIAVLPFTDMSAAHDQEYFCDGFTEELISTLAAVENLRVVARTSVFFFKNKAGDIREIAKTLNAGVVLEGSVRRSGGTLRITAQLIRAQDGYHLWSKSYDRSSEDVLAVQQEIAQLIAGTLQKQMPGGTARAAKLEAHDLYLLGRHHWNRIQPGDLEKAIGYFESSIKLDPNYAAAYSGLADAYSYMIDGDMAPTAEILPKARAAADRALELDPRSAEAHTARGLVAHELEWDQERARKEFLRAVELGPSYAYGIHWYAHFLFFEGRRAEAEATMKRALAIDPLSRLYTIDLAMFQYTQRRFDEALRYVDRAAELDPEYYLLEIVRAMVFQAQGDWARTRAELAKAKKRLGDDPLIVGVTARTEALAGNPATARRLLAELRVAGQKGYVPDYGFALVHYALGEVEQGRSYLRRGLEAHNGALVWLKETPMFDQVKADGEGRRLLGLAGGAGVLR